MAPKSMLLFGAIFLKISPLITFTGRHILSSKYTIIRRQDLHSRSIKAVLDLLQQVTIDHGLFVRLFCISIDLVRNIEIIQPRLQYKGFWIM